MKMERCKKRDKAMRSNNIFQKDEGNFYQKTNKRSTYKGQVPAMDKLVKFRASIWENGRLTVCSYHIAYTFQSESTHYSYLIVKELLAQNRRDI